MKIAKSTLELAEKYAQLSPEDGYADFNNAIKLAKALLRANKALKSAESWASYE